MKKLNLKFKLNKKVLLALIAVILVMALGVGAYFYFSQPDEPEAPSLKQVLKEKLSAYETDLVDSLGSMETSEDVANYLMNWAENKQIAATKDNAGSVIFTIPPTEGAEEAQPTAIICNFDAEHMDSYVTEMATALCVAKNSESHGKLSIVFMPVEDGEMVGAKDFDMNHFEENTAVFVLGSSSAAKVSMVTGAYQYYQITDELTYQPTTFNKAYKITMSGIPSNPMEGSIGDYPNPIKTFGTVLANFKSTSLLFELASFEGGETGMATPAEATMVVVINESDTTKFTNKMENSIGKIKENFGEDSGIVYTYEEVELPQQVISNENKDTLVSMMYTSFNGIYNRTEEGNITSLTNIDFISTEDNLLTIDVAAMGYSEYYLSEISDTYATICGLCNMDFEIIEKEYHFDVNAGYGVTATTEVLESFEAAFLEFTEDESMKKDSTAEFTPCTYLQQKDKEMPILYFSITPKTMVKFAGSIVTFMDANAQPEA